MEAEEDRLLSCGLGERKLESGDTPFYRLEQPPRAASFVTGGAPDVTYLDPGRAERSFGQFFIHDADGGRRRITFRHADVRDRFCAVTVEREAGGAFTEEPGIAILREGRTNYMTVVDLLKLFEGTDTRYRLKAEKVSNTYCYTLAKAPRGVGEVKIPNVEASTVEWFKQVEGFRSTAYYATEAEKAIGLMTIGIGVTFFKGTGNKYENATLTEEEAVDLLYDTLYSRKFVPNLNSFLAKHQLVLDQHQYDAMLSITYQLGQNIFTAVDTADTAIYGKGSYSYDFLDVLIQPGFLTSPMQTQIDAFETHLLKYINAVDDKGQTKRLSGLWNRRKNEFDLFMTADYAKETYDKATADAWLAGHGFASTEE